MELHWCAIPGGNFGDDLNPQLWPRLFPDLGSHRHDARLYGIGTLLGGRHDGGGAKLVLGSGGGDTTPRRLQGQWDFRWVRGPLTARTMQLDSRHVLGDSAWLWDGLRVPLQPDGTIGLVPHCATWSGYDWPRVAALAGMRAINPQRAPDAVVDDMRRCSMILTESLHGAVFADAMGIPWAVCRLSYRFNEFKWRDWTQFIRRCFEPHDVSVALASQLRRRKALTNRLARWADFRGQSRYNPLRPVANATAAEAAKVADELRRFGADTSRFACSPPSFVARQTERMVDACAAFAKDYGLTFRPPAHGPQFTAQRAWPQPLQTVAPAPAAACAPARSAPVRRHA
jgi:succinoglycan biosynthesis protein ExoV